jgi:hypothetical protein
MVTRCHSIRERRYGARVVNAVATAGIPGSLLAHQGGWDEVLLVAGPIAVVVGLLWLARRRVTRPEHPSADERPSAEPSDSDHPALG